MRAALKALGICSDGIREILGVKMGEIEGYATWDEMFQWLHGRGLKGVMFVMSDGHGRSKTATKGVRGDLCQTRSQGSGMHGSWF